MWTLVSCPHDYIFGTFFGITFGQVLHFVFDEKFQNEIAKNTTFFRRICLCASFGSLLSFFYKSCRMGVSVLVLIMSMAIFQQYLISHSSIYIQCGECIGFIKIFQLSGQPCDDDVIFDLCRFGRLKTLKYVVKSGKCIINSSCIIGAVQSNEYDILVFLYKKYANDIKWPP